MRAGLGIEMARRYGPLHRRPCPLEIADFGSGLPLELVTSSDATGDTGFLAWVRGDRTLDRPQERLGGPGVHERASLLRVNGPVLSHSHPPVSPARDEPRNRRVDTPTPAPTLG